MKKKLYDKDSIQSLDPLTFVRLRPGVYVGSTTYSTQLLVEAISNSVDEFKIGNGKEINITISKDNTVSVEDFGQGFLINSMREDGKTILEASFSVINTSGKYKDDGVYEGTALGLNGIGSKLCIFLTNKADVITYRDGQFEHIWFNEGVFEKREVGKTTRANGTIVTWTPSKEFFEHVEVDIKEIDRLLNVLCCLCPGLKITLDNKGDKKVYFSQKGLDDLVDKNTKGKEIIKNRFHTTFKDGRYELDFILTYINSYTSTIIPYVNTGFTERGPHITFVKSLITREFNKFFREQGWLKEKDENFSGDDIQEGCYIVFNMTAPNVSYDAQTKSSIVKIDVTSFSNALTNDLRDWLQANVKEIKPLADKALIARKAREAAKKAKEKARDTGGKKEKSKLVSLPTKLVDAWSKNRKDCELVVCEGNSAASGLIEARDAEFNAIFPIRGKIIAAYKNTIEKIFANAEVNNLVKAIGLELDSNTKKLTYDVNKLRYGKIILAADAK